MRHQKATYRYEPPQIPTADRPLFGTLALARPFAAPRPHDAEHRVGQLQCLREAEVAEAVRSVRLAVGDREQVVRPIDGRQQVETAVVEIEGLAAVVVAARAGTERDARHGARLPVLPSDARGIAVDPDVAGAAALLDGDVGAVPEVAERHAGHRVAAGPHLEDVDLVGASPAGNVVLERSQLRDVDSRIGHDVERLHHPPRGEQFEVAQHDERVVERPRQSFGQAAHETGHGGLRRSGAHGGRQAEEEKKSFHCGKSDRSGLQR